MPKCRPDHPACVAAQKSHLIGLAELLKALVSLFIARVLIWVQLPCQHIVGALYLLRRSILQVR